MSDFEFRRAGNTSKLSRAHSESKGLFFLVSLAMVFVSGLVRAETEGAKDAETIYLDETYISGNQELPKVLYILPWKRQGSGAIPAARPRSSLDRVMTLVYPHEYRLELAFRARAETSENALSNSRPGNDEGPTNGPGKTNGQTQTILKED